jgi:predicted enzyme related to lactoylglutathione lyase
MSLNNVPGEPNWIELFTPDPDGARTFYGGLFGWTAVDSGSGGYLTFERDGKPVAGCMENDGESPDSWHIYFETDDAAATVAMAKANGGEEVHGAMEVGDLGTMAVVTDPAGATVFVWQPKEMAGFATRAEDGAPAWFELLTSGYDAALPFYANVFGWDIHTMSDTAEFRYSTLGKDEHALAGIMDATAMLAGQPSYWNVYLQVADTDAALVKAIELGGSELMAPNDTPYGRLASIADPTGVPFMVMGPNLT